MNEETLRHAMAGLLEHALDRGDDTDDLELLDIDFDDNSSDLIATVREVDTGERHDIRIMLAVL